MDDVTGETLAYAMIEALLAAGAHDAWVTPIVMKKGRPAHTVSALADVAVADALVEVMVATTGTFGVRRTALDRHPRPRRLDAVDVAGHRVAVKVGPHRTKVEHDDAARVAEATGLAVPEVISRAEEAWRRRSG